jgi:hypothetical protein
MLGSGVEIAAIYQRHVERGFTGSYAVVYRLARQIQPSPRQKTTLSTVARQ